MLLLGYIPPVKIHLDGPIRKGKFDRCEFSAKLFTLHTLGYLKFQMIFAKTHSTNVGSSLFEGQPKYYEASGNQRLSTSIKVSFLIKVSSLTLDSLMDPCPTLPESTNPIKRNDGMVVPRTVAKESVRWTLGNRLRTV